MRVPRLAAVIAATAAGAATVALLTGCGTTQAAGTAAPAATAKTTTTAGTPATGDLITMRSAEVLAKAKYALATAKTVHLVGTADTGGMSVTLDLRVKGNADAVGTLVLNGAKMEVRKLGDKMYFRAGVAVWTSVGVPAEPAKLLADKWVLMPASALGVAAGEINSLITLKGLTSVLTPTGTVKEPTGGWPTATVNGTPTIKLTDSGGGTLYVATTGPAYPVRIVDATDAENPGQLDLTEFNQPVTVPVPPTSQILTMPS